MERIPNKLSLDIHPILSKHIPYNGPTCDLALNLNPNREPCVMATDTDRALKNISSILFEENNDGDHDAYPEEASLQAVEKSFYDILGQNYPSKSSDGNLPQFSSTQSHAVSPVTFSDSNHDISSCIVKFNKGLKEGLKFLPSAGDNKATFDLQGNNKRWFTSNNKEDNNLFGKKIAEGEEDRELMILPCKRLTNYEDMSLSRGAACEFWRFLPHGERKCKISELYFNNREEVFDNVLLLREEIYIKEAIRVREIKQREIRLHHKKEIYENLVDLRSLLMQCAQAMSTNEIQHAHQLIKQIRKNSSPDGNGDQRMAHIFVNGLEARLNGATDEINQQLMVQETMIDHLNEFHMSLISTPFLFASQYFVNHTIINAIKKESKLHIIHFGVEYGFHWPCLIQTLSQRKGGPPMLRITGIDSPTSGISITSRLEVAGKRLEDYARIFGVPFEYRGIGAKWDEICIEDLYIEKDEVVIVNCLRGLEFLGDETNITYSPKNQFLEIIRQIKPTVFIQGIINGSYTSSFFADRFKQVLLYSSAVFDMLDKSIPRCNNKLRWYLENYVLGRMAINVIACEGSKRYVRPETYKQWHVRNLRAKYNQLQLDQTIINQIKNKVSQAYNKGFFLEDDNEWLLFGWKGRVMSAISTWQPQQT